MLEELRAQLEQLTHAPGELGNPGDEEPPDLLLESARQCGDDQVELRIHLYSCGQRHSEWLVRATGVAAMSIELGVHGDVHVLGEHPLLLEHRDDRAQLSFRGPVARPYAVVWELLEAHRSVIGRWLPAHYYWNYDPTALLSAPAGVFAQGPVTLMSAYAGVLERYGTSTSLLAMGPASRVVDPLALSETAERSRRLHEAPLLQQVEETRHLQVLLFDPGRRALALSEALLVPRPRGSHVIAEAFSCMLVSGGSGS